MTIVIPEFATANIRDPAGIHGPGSRLFVLAHYGRDDNAS
jgi:hypothetical protein